MDKKTIIQMILTIIGTVLAVFAFNTAGCSQTLELDYGKPQFKTEITDIEAAKAIAAQDFRATARWYSIDGCALTQDLKGDTHVGFTYTPDLGGWVITVSGQGQNASRLTFKIDGFPVRVAGIQAGGSFVTGEALDENVKLIIQRVISGNVLKLYDRFTLVGTFSLVGSSAAIKNL